MCLPPLQHDVYGPDHILHLDGAPNEERCVAVGRDDYEYMARNQCHILIRQIRRVLGCEPDGAILCIDEVHHHLGTFYVAAYKYRSNDPVATYYAQRLEDEPIQYWDEIARLELASI